MKTFLAIFLLLLLTAVNIRSVSAGELEAFTVYDPVVNGLEKVYRYAPKKTDDLTASFDIIQGTNGEYALEVTFTGTDMEAESGQPRIGLTGYELPEGYIFKYFRVLMECDEPLISMGGAAIYQGGHDLFPCPVNTTELSEVMFRPNNLNEYDPEDYGTLAFWTKSTAAYRIYKIDIMAEKITETELPITNRTTVLEVLPENMPAESVDTLLYNTDIPSGTLSARVSYNNRNLLIAVNNLIGRNPIADHTVNDVDVWKDECHEIFLSPAANNVERYQFSINCKDVVFDTKYGFNDTAGQIINDLNWTMQYQKESVCTGGRWDAVYSFPFEQFRFDPAESRFMLFRIGQCLAEPERITSWPFLNDSFLGVSSYAALLFNPVPFGQGWLEIDAMNAINDGEGIKVSGRTGNIPAGDYTLELRLLRPAGDFKTTSIPLKSNGNIEDFVITYKGPCPAGNYRAYILLTNKDNASLLAAVDGNYSRPVQVQEEPVLHPYPKKIILQEGYFPLVSGTAVSIPADATERTKLTAEQFTELLYGITGVCREITTAAADIELRLGEGQPQGYNIKITPDKITITGFDEAGLYYGTRMLVQLHNSFMEILAERPVPCCEITDWPDIEKRIGILIAPVAAGYYEANPDPVAVRSIDDLKKHVSELFISNRFNYLIVDMTETVELPRHPEMNDCPVKPGTGTIAKPLYTMEDLKSLAEFCRDNFIEIIPSLPYHRNGWVYRNHQEFNHAGIYHDVEHPDYDRIYFGVADELLDAFEEVAPVNYFFTDLSELYLDCSREVLDEIAREDPVGRFERGINKINDFCRERGIRMMMYSDMLNPYWPAIFPYSTIIDRLPREIALCHWQTDPISDDGPVKYFHDKGFEVWGMGSCLQDRLSPDARKYLTAYGKGIAYLGGCWQPYDTDFGEYWSINTMFYAADYGWNLSMEIPEYSDQKSAGNIQKVRQIASVQGNPAASEKIDIIDLTPYFNTAMKKYAQDNFPGGQAVFPEGETDICNIPMELSENFVLLGKDSGLELSLHQKASSLIFLTAGHLPAGCESLVAGLNYVEYSGTPAGDFIVNYADGTQELIPMRQYRNYDYINQLPEMRASVDCRYAMLIPRVGGDYFTLHQYEWVNPHPEKEIVSLGYKHDYPPRFNGAEIPTKLMLFSLSARQVK